MIFRSEAVAYIALALGALMFVAGLVADFRVGRWRFALGLVVAAAVLTAAIARYFAPDPRIVFVQSPPLSWPEAVALWAAYVVAWPFTLGTCFGTMARKERLAASRRGQDYAH